MRYWCGKSLVITVNGPDGTFQRRLDRPFARIGSHPRSDVTLAGAVIPKRALYLHAVAEGLYCLPLESPDPENLQSPGCWLDENRPLQIGPYEILIRVEGPAAEPAATFGGLCESAGVPGPWPTFNVFQDGEFKQRVRLRAPLNLAGRMAICKLRFRSASVSGHHTALYSQHGRIWAVDLASSHGCRLNGDYFEFGELLPGDKLQIGEFTVVPEKPEDSGSSVLKAAAAQHTAMTNRADMRDAGIRDTGVVEPSLARSLAAPPTAPRQLDFPSADDNALDNDVMPDRDGNGSTAMNDPQATADTRKMQAAVLGGVALAEREDPPESAHLVSEVNSLRSDLANQTRELAGVRNLCEEMMRQLTEESRMRREAESRLISREAIITPARFDASHFAKRAAVVEESVVSVPALLERDLGVRTMVLDAPAPAPQALVTQAPVEARPAFQLEPLVTDTIDERAMIAAALAPPAVMLTEEQRKERNEMTLFLNDRLAELEPPRSYVMLIVTVLLSVTAVVVVSWIAMTMLNQPSQ